MAISIVHIITSLEIGGAQKVLFDLVTGSTASFSHTIYFIHDGPYRKRFEDAGIACKRIAGLLLPYDPFLILKTLVFLLRARPHIIHTHLWAATIIGRLISFIIHVPCITSYHNHLMLLTGFRRFLDRFTRWFSKKFIAVSHAITHELQQSYGTRTAKKIITIPNGVAIPRMTASDQAAVFTVGCVSRLVPEKNIDLVVMQFAQLYAEYPKARLIIVGSGPQKHQLQSLVNVIGLAHVIRFVGIDAHEWYHQFDCFVQLSKTEGLSLALLEAMSYGVVPIVAESNNTNGIVVHEYNGLVIEKNRLVDAFSRVLDLQLRKQLVIHARDTVIQKYSIGRLVDDYEKCWHEVSTRI